MEISNTNNKNKIHNNGFTLVELAVVIAGLASLSAIAIPNVLTSIRLNKIEEAKAIMNGYAISCINKVREDPQKYNEEKLKDLDSTKLKTLGYEIVDNKNKCDEISIKPIKENEKDVYPFGFILFSNGVFLKTATPPINDNDRFILSCQRWAGDGCSLSDERLAKAAAAEELRKKEQQCNNEVDTWKRNNFDGEHVKWNEDEKKCNKIFCYFDEEEIQCDDLEDKRDERLKKEQGEKCLNWAKKEARKSNEPNAVQSPDPKSGDGCNGKEFWFHTGEKYESQEEWDKQDLEFNRLLLEENKQRCEKDREEAIKTAKGKYVIGQKLNLFSPSPCQDPIWVCNGKKENSESAYEKTTCYTESQAPPPKDNKGEGEGCNYPPGFDQLCIMPDYKSMEFCKCQ